MILSVIPEKDYVIDKDFLQTGRFGEIDAAIGRLQQACAALGAPLIYNNYLELLYPFETPGDFTYLDSHLPWRHYIQIYAKLLAAIGLNWQNIAPKYGTKETQVFGDLQKFTRREPKASWARVPYVYNERLTIEAGSHSFATPLGATRQLIVNENPLEPGKVLLLGDSHSSILSKNNLTYLFASTFEKCEFHWNPFGIREMPETTDADVVIMEMSLRFFL